MQKALSFATLALIVAAAVYDFEPTAGIATLAALTVVWLGSRLRLTTGAYATSADQLSFDMIAFVSGLFLVVAIDFFVGRREGTLATLASIIIVAHSLFDDTGARHAWHRKNV